ncbi:GyrI-like domain-containing protein [Chloroflexota bacterium]
MKLLELKKQYKFLYQPSAKKIETVQVPNLQFAMLNGAIEQGSEPGKSPAFAEATQALYSLSYTLKFMFKKRKTNAVDYPVMPLQGLWGLQDTSFDIGKKDNWTFTLMILQPEIITKNIFEEAREQVRKKKGDSDMLNKVRLTHFEEGLCVQTMHIGPYATEPATIDRMKVYMAENGLKDNVGPNGLHHEIYISDPRKAAPDKMKTIVRHPVIKL